MMLLTENEEVSIDCRDCGRQFVTTDALSIYCDLCAAHRVTCKAFNRLQDENLELRKLLDAAFSDLNLYWRDDFENRGLAIAIRKVLGKS